mmetsp:Transcript_45751/g.106927  ORF Transcript_45751/g.106927 Transcript_45751/m.106927 type:complete len:280 (-) Transcript_45751:317-1156(-)
MLSVAFSEISESLDMLKASRSERFDKFKKSPMSSTCVSNSSVELSAPLLKFAFPSDSFSSPPRGGSVLLLPDAFSPTISDTFTSVPSPPGLTSSDSVSLTLDMLSLSSSPSSASLSRLPPVSFLTITMSPVAFSWLSLLSLLSLVSLVSLVSFKSSSSSASSPSAETFVSFVKFSSPAKLSVRLSPPTVSTTSDLCVSFSACMQSGSIAAQSTYCSSRSRGNCHHNDTVPPSAKSAAASMAESSPTAQSSQYHTAPGTARDETTDGSSVSLTGKYIHGL